MPVSIVRVWLAERDTWLRQHGIDPAQPGWEAVVGRWPADRQRQCRQYLSERWDSHLDELHGDCVLRRPDCARIVAQSLCHFDLDRYYLSDYVVMPNHVHVLAAFSSEEGMLAQCKSWKQFTARKINALLKRQGRFWEQDAFDHLVRSPEEFEHLRAYIAQNPLSSRLGSSEYLHYRKE